MHNVLTAACNAIISVAKKVEDNVLRVMTAPVAAIRCPNYPRSRSAGCPAQGTQCPRHQVGTHAFREAQGG